jgi:hypothetical protein
MVRQDPRVGGWSHLGDPPGGEVEEWRIEGEPCLMGKAYRNAENWEY